MMFLFGLTIGIGVIGGLALWFLLKLAKGFRW